MVSRRFFNLLNTRTQLGSFFHWGESRNIREKQSKRWRQWWRKQWGGGSGAAETEAWRFQCAWCDVFSLWPTTLRRGSRLHNARLRYKMMRICFITLAFAIIFAPSACSKRCSWSSEREETRGAGTFLTRNHFSIIIPPIGSRGLVFFLECSERTGETRLYRALREKVAPNCLFCCCFESLYCAVSSAAVAPPPPKVAATTALLLLRSSEIQDS